MKIPINKLFENSYVISCDSDRLNLMKAHFMRYGLPFPQVFKAFRNKSLSGINNCSLSHAAIVKDAKQKDLPFVCIFEDDAYPRIDVIEKLENLEYPDNVDMVSFGCHTTNIEVKDGWNLIPEEKISYGSHAYVIFKSGYDKLLETYRQNKYTPPDFVWAMNDAKSYLYHPSIFIQYNVPGRKTNCSMGGYQYMGKKGIAKKPPEGFDVAIKQPKPKLVRKHGIWVISMPKLVIDSPKDSLYAQAIPHAGSYLNGPCE